MIPIAKPLLGEEEKKAVSEVIASGIIAEGPRVSEFEKKFAEYVGVKYAIATSSGTAALHLALLSCGVKEGDEVIVPSFSFIATANSALFCNAKPVFADIEDETYTIDVHDIKEKITRKTKTIMPVHLYGHPADMKAIQETASENNLPVIEDACQAHGAKYHGKKVGSIGDAGCFSFYPTKNMTTGEGGMLTTDDEKIAEKARMLRQHGARERYRHEILGFNYRMTDIAAAIGLCQLKKLDGFNKKRIENAQHLTDRIRDVPWIKTPVVKKGCGHVFHQYTIKTEGRERDDILKALNKKGIGASIYYPTPIHKQTLYRNLDYDIFLPKTEKCARTVLSLPVHPGVPANDLNFISEALMSIR